MREKTKEEKTVEEVRIIDCMANGLVMLTKVSIIKLKGLIATAKKEGKG